MKKSTYNAIKFHEKIIYIGMEYNNNTYIARISVVFIEKKIDVLLVFIIYY